MILEMSGIQKSFGGLEVLKDITLHVDSGEVVSVIGPSGSGKSTLLRCATFLETIDAGEIRYMGQTAATTGDQGKAVYLNHSELNKVKRYFGLVFQQFNLFPHYSVLKNIMDAPVSVQKRPKEEVHKEAMELLRKMNLENRADAYPCQLSGGQQQRVAIARALALKPSILFFDEPTSALDPSRRGIRKSPGGAHGTVPAQLSAMNAEYYVLDPTGNITILVSTPVPQDLQVRAASVLMEREAAAEQVGFLSEGRDCDLSLRMAGGEFCGNASMCAAVIAAMRKGKKKDSIRLRVSGAPGFVTARVEEMGDGSFKGSVNMPAPGKIETRALPGAGKHPVVSFDGISHIILEEPIPKEDAEVLAGEWCRALGADAVGLMFLDRTQDTLTPLVYVPSAGTLFWENSCASGTTAVGAYLAAESGKHVVKALRQPGGELTVDAYPDGALTITGTVRLQRSVSCLLNLML